MSFKQTRISASIKSKAPNNFGLTTEITKMSGEDKKKRGKKVSMTIRIKEESIYNYLDVTPDFYTL